MTLEELAEDIKERLKDAEKEWQESHRLAMNSYGTGYERGFADALKETLEHIDSK